MLKKIGGKTKLPIITNQEIIIGRYYISARGSSPLCVYVCIDR